MAVAKPLPATHQRIQDRSLGSNSVAASRIYSPIAGSAMNAGIQVSAIKRHGME